MVQPSGRRPPWSLRYYPPEKQGLRRLISSIFVTSNSLRYYPPEKQGLRRSRDYPDWI